MKYGNHALNTFSERELLMKFLLLRRFGFAQPTKLLGVPAANLIWKSAVEVQQNCEIRLTKTAQQAS